MDQKDPWKQKHSILKCGGGDAANALLRRKFIAPNLEMRKSLSTITKILGEKRENQIPKTEGSK